MFKKIVSGFLALFILTTLTGCVGASGLNEEELGQVAEYAAKKVLSHTKGYEPKLLQTLELTKENEEVKEEFRVIGEKDEKVSSEKRRKKKEEPGGKNPGRDVLSEESAKSLNEVFRVPGFEVIYSGAREALKYSEKGGSFSLSAPEGMKLMVVEFKVKNKTDKVAVFKQNSDIDYELGFGDRTYRPSITLLERDIKFIEEKVDGKKSVTAVLLFHLPRKEKKAKAKLRVNGKNGSYQISVGQ